MFLFMFFFLKHLFGLFLSFCGGFYAIKKVCGLKLQSLWLRLLSFWLRYFNPRVLYNSALGLYLGHDNMSKTVTLLGLIVYFLNIKNRLETCFNLNFKRFLDYLFLSI